MGQGAALLGLQSAGALGRGEGCGEAVSLQQHVLGSEQVHRGPCGEAARALTQGSQCKEAQHALQQYPADCYMSAGNDPGWPAEEACAGIQRFPRPPMVRSTRPASAEPGPQEGEWLPQWPRTPTNPGMQLLRVPVAKETKAKTRTNLVSWGQNACLIQKQAGGGSFIWWSDVEKSQTPSTLNQPLY